ncbi:hypothetical protein H0H87_005691 [Tephrocybe sp. NHM501043]|nr:hypothetical protein H0H87_005691 [Tephrocybe sp. NHM501043]
MRFYNLIVLTSLAISSFGATVADVETDIGNISTQLAALDAAITAYSPDVGVGTLAQALTVPTPIADSDAQAILALIEALEPTIDDALLKIVARKAALVALPLGGLPALVKQDLANLNASTNGLESALIASAPVSSDFGGGFPLTDREIL